MKRWFGIAVLLCVAAATPLAAQQATSPVPPARASVAQAGPRLQPEFRRAQPAFADSTASASAVVAETHTIRMTTIVLVLVVVILVLLIAK